MLIPRFVAWLFAVSVMILGAGVVSGQNYPTKPIRILSGEPGTGGDFVARLIAEGLTVNLGQQVVVDNRGGSAIIPAQIVAKAPPDGYTLFFYGATIWILPLMQNVPYDMVRDFSPITWAVSLPTILVVHPSLPVKSVKELIALAKATPGALNYGAGTIGSTTHIASELFKAMAGVDIVAIPYKGSGTVLNALIAGEVQLAVVTPSSGAPHVKSGRLRALAVTSAQPSALVPGLPTVAASLPGFEADGRLGIWAPAKTPAAIINRLNQEVVQVLNRADVKERLLNAGFEVVGNSPEQFAAAIRSEMAKLGKVIKDAGIRVE